MRLLIFPHYAFTQLASLDRHCRAAAATAAAAWFYLRGRGTAPIDRFLAELITDNFRPLAVWLFAVRVSSSALFQQFSPISCWRVDEIRTICTFLTRKYLQELIVWPGNNFTLFSQHQTSRDSFQPCCSLAYNILLIQHLIDSLDVNKHPATLC